MNAKEKKEIVNPCELYEVALDVLVTDIIKRMREMAGCGEFEVEIWDSSHENGRHQLWKSSSYTINKTIMQHLQYLFSECLYDAKISEEGACLTISWEGKSMWKEIAIVKNPSLAKQLRGS